MALLRPAGLQMPAVRQFVYRVDRAEPAAGNALRIIACSAAVTLAEFSGYRYGRKR